MPEGPDDLTMSQALRDGLRALPVPEASPDFDARILTALRAPRPWWQRLWQPAKPLLLGASCSLTVTLFALHWTMAVPQPPILREPERSVTVGRAMPSLDALLNRPDLSAGSLSGWATRPPIMPSQDRRPEPHRKAQLLRHPILIV